MKILDFVRPELVVADIQARDKEAVLAELAGFIATRVDGAERPEGQVKAERVDPGALLKVLVEREREVGRRTVPPGAGHRS
jgi:hypothetical protein